MPRAARAESGRPSREPSRGEATEAEIMGREPHVSRWLAARGRGRGGQEERASSEPKRTVEAKEAESRTGHWPVMMLRRAAQGLGRGRRKPGHES